MELITTHTHTVYSGHGVGTIAEMTDAAEAAGISVMAVTEHYPMSAAFDPTHHISMPESKLDTYRAEIEQARLDHPGMDILYGTELDWLGDCEDRDLDDSLFDDFEIVLGSVHFVDGWAFDDPARRDHWYEVGVDAIWKRYFEIWCEACVSHRPFTVMSHPDLVKKFGFFPTIDPTPLYDSAAEAAVAGERMIELNTSGTYCACREAYPAPALLERFQRAGVPATVGTDAHQPETIARDIDVAYRLLHDAGYRYVTVPTRDGDRRRIPIE